MPEIFGRYNLIEVLGEESAATVYKAIDSDEDREVLLKIVQTRNFSLDNMQLVRQRFDREINSIAGLHHPNIREILDHGEQRGKPFLVMPWLEGITLEQILSERKQIPWHEALTIITPIAEALSYAHSRDIFHLDIKPANIFLDQSNNPLLQNFHSILMLGDESTLDSCFLFLGTPAYMAPELNTTETVDTQTEVYALGIVLYEMITGRTPYVTKDSEEMLSKHANQALPAPFQFVKHLSEDVELVLYRALEKNPIDRFVSMEEFAIALRQITAIAPTEIAESESIVALPLESDPSVQEEPVSTTLRSTEILATAFEVQGSDNTQVEEFTQTETEKSEADIKNTEGNLPPALGVPEPVTLATQEIPQIPNVKLEPVLIETKEILPPPIILPESIPSILESTPTISPDAAKTPHLPALQEAVLSAEARRADNKVNTHQTKKKKSKAGLWIGFELALIALLIIVIVVTGKKVESNSLADIASTERAANYLTNELETRLGDGVINGLAYSPDGKTLAVSSATGVYIYYTNTLEFKKILDNGENMNAIAFSPSGDTLAVSTLNNSILLWNVEGGSLSNTLENASGNVVSISYSPYGNILASGSTDGSIDVWDSYSGDKVSTLSGYSEGVTTLAFSSDASILASAAYSDNKIILWDTSNWSTLNTFYDSSAEVTSLAFSPDGMNLASSSLQGDITIRGVFSGTILQTLHADSGKILSMAFSIDGRTLVSSNSWNNSIILWDVANAIQLQTYDDPSILINFHSTLSPDGLTVASSSMDGTITLLNTANSKEQKINPGFSESVIDIAFSPDGKTIASASYDETIALWDVTSHNKIQSLSGHMDTVNCVAFSPDGQTLASGSWNNELFIWDMNSHMQIKSLSGHSDWINDVEFSPDGTLLASSSYDSKIILWDTETWSRQKTLIGHTNGVNGIAFSPDGHTLASSSDDNTVILYDVESGAQIRTLTGHTNYVNDVAFSPDGLTLATGSTDLSIILWDTTSWNQKQTLSGHTSDVTSLSFSPDGLKLASGSWGKEVIIWGATTGRKLATLTGHRDGVTSVHFSPDGSILASGSWDGTIQLWSGNK